MQHLSLRETEKAKKSKSQKKRNKLSMPERIRGSIKIANTKSFRNKLWMPKKTEEAKQ